MIIISVVVPYPKSDHNILGELYIFKAHHLKNDHKKFFSNFVSTTPRTNNQKCASLGQALVLYSSVRVETRQTL
jgi:hypothetical protein